MNSLKRFTLGSLAAFFTVCAVFAQSQKKTVLATNIGDLSWSNNIAVKANAFNDATEKSVITIEASQTKADYHKFKLYSTQGSWKELGSEGVSGASFANGEITVEKPSSTITVKLSKQQAEDLKKAGMVMHGFGVSIKKMELLSASSKSAANSSKKTASSKSNTKSGSAKTTLPFDLGNWQNVVLSAKDLNGPENSSIKITTKASAKEKNPSYLNLKLYIADSWQPVGRGKLASSKNGSLLQGDLFVLSKAEEEIIYTPTQDEQKLIEKSGLRIQGYGISVDSVQKVPSPKVSQKAKAPAGSKTPASSKKPAKKTTTVSSPSPILSLMGTPYENHGKLHVSGTFLCDSNDRPVQLYGMSTHGLSWFGEYVSKESFTSLRDDWNTNCVRLVLYPGDYNGYCNGGNKKELEKLVYKGIEEATALGMYVIVDWHIHNDNPNKYKDEAKKFLGTVSKKYSSYGNILYEICNEPVNSDWNSQIKPYAEEIIPVIRKNAPDAVIIVGTNTWSQDVDKAAANPITKYKNIMYTFHFYANTHTDSFRSKLESAIKAKLPVFITEFGTCDASGNGGYNEQQTKLWFDLINKYNLCHMNWSLCNKAETASAISPSCQKKSGWTESELSQSGRLIRNHFRSLKRQ